MDKSKLDLFDIVVAGPPCHPFTRTGAQNQWTDARADAYSAIVHTIADQAERPQSRLIAFALENVAGFADKLRGTEKSPADEVLQYFREKLGKAWNVWTWLIRTDRLGFPQDRRRVYLCGRRIDAFATPMPPRAPTDYNLKKFDVEDILDPNLPKEKRLTQKMVDNIEHYKAAAAAANLKQGQVVLCDLTRAPGKVRATVLKYDGTTPTLTCTNKSLYVFAVGTDRYERFLSAAERAILQGFSGSIVSRLPKPFTAIGNAMSVPAIGMCLACLLNGVQVVE